VISIFVQRETSVMTPGNLARWYLRLNGFSTMTNFIVHPESPRASQQTDVDIWGVRFPFRLEFGNSNDHDEPEFREWRKVLLAITEVTRDECKLNGPWVKPNEGTIVSLLRALGPIERTRLDDVVSALATQGAYEDAQYRCFLCCIGESESSEIRKRHPQALQKPWGGVIEFIHARLMQWSRLKADHEQWDEAGQSLWRLFEGGGYDRHRFSWMVRDQFRLRPPR
jgi:hypothetical protein